MAPKIQRKSIVTAATAYADQSENEESFEIPADLATLSDEDLATLTSSASEHFSGLYGDGKGLTAEQYEVLSILTEGIERLATENTARQTLAAERDAAAAELAARVNPTAAVTETAGAETVVEETIVEEPATEEVLVASGSRIPMSALQKRAGQARSQVVVERETEQEMPKGPQSLSDVMFAADTPGISTGSNVDIGDLAKSLDRKLKAFPEAVYEQAAFKGEPLREHFGLAVIKKEIPTDLIAMSNDPTHVQEVMDRAVDQSRLPGGSLVASGGWCAPSETLYDLIELESRDGLLSLPEIGVARGGIKFTTGPSFADIYNKTGFAFTETQDIAAQYAFGTLPADWAATTAIGQGLFRKVGTVGNYIIMVATVGGTTGSTAPNATTLPIIGATLVDGSVTWTRVQGVTPLVAGSKPCYHVECPPFVEARLDVVGLCLTAGLLQSRGYPEVIARVIRGALIAHDHKVSASSINAMVTGSTAISLTAGQAGAAAPVLTAIELQVEHYKYTHRMPRSTVLEAIFPYWVRGAIRSDLSRRLGVNLLSVSDSEIDGWFRDRGIAAQFVYDWQTLDVVAATAFVAWPSSVKFLLYAAGTWVRGTSDIITLDTIYDSTNLGQNDYTALFTEEGYFVAKRGFDSRVITVPIVADGATAMGVDISALGVG